MRLLKYICLSVSSLTCTLLFVELLGHGFIVFRYGQTLPNLEWANQIFTIGSFLQFIDDERVIIPKPGYDDHFVRIDTSGFKKGMNEYAVTKWNIVFLGDSVPFGYGIGEANSVPSYFYGFLKSPGMKNLGVINAAVPSYTLHQSIVHYEKSVHGKYPVQAVILQTYDPVNQFIRHGKYWNNSINWANSGEKVNPYAVLIRNNSWLRYSSILFLAFPVYLGANPPAVSISPRDLDLFQTFQVSIYDDLNRLYKIIQQDGGTLVLLPVNPAKSVQRAGGDILSVVIKRYNDSLRIFADTHNDVLFADVQTYFDSIGRDGLFRDACCHLTEKGSRGQAEFLYNVLVKTNQLE